MNDWSKLSEFIVQLLREAQEDGYVTEENQDLEVAEWMGAMSYQITDKATKILEPETYFKYQGKYYRLKDIQKLDEVIND